MLTADHVRARRRKGRLQLLKLEGKARAQALELAETYVAIAARSVGGTREAFDEACGALVVEGWNRRLAAGLHKLVQDRCVFEAPEGVDPPALRRALFTRAAAARKALDTTEAFDRGAALAAAEAELGLGAGELEPQLYADLRGAQRLLSFEALDAEQLVEGYLEAQAQAVLLKAARLTAEVRCASAATFRRLFHKLKFLRLLFTMERLGEAGAYRLVVDGPFSLFSSVTKYGLQLALLLPALQECDAWSLEADLLWGKGREPLKFALAGQRAGGSAPGRRARLEHLPDVVRALLRRFRARDTPWRCRPCAEILNLPGVGLCVPDLLFTHGETGVQVYLEVMGFWSREAVWKRVELVQAGLRQRILFALSSRLRVSEQVLDDELPGALYVYKGAMLPGVVEERLDRLAGGT